MRRGNRKKRWRGLMLKNMDVLMDRTCLISDTVRVVLL